MAPEHWDTGKQIERAQQRSMNLSDVEKGYGAQVDAAFAGKSGAAVRNEIQQFLKLRPVLAIDRGRAV